MDIKKEFYTIIYGSETEKRFITTKTRYALINGIKGIDLDISDEELCKYIYENKIDIVGFRGIGKYGIIQVVKGIKLLLNK